MRTAMLGATTASPTSAVLNQIHPNLPTVLVQHQMERGGSPLGEYSALQEGFLRHEGLPIRSGLFEERRSVALRSVHRLVEPARLSLSMVASPQCRFRFVPQDDCRSATISASSSEWPVILAQLGKLTNSGGKHIRATGG
jgi:hypothetical protein